MLSFAVRAGVAAIAVGAVVTFAPINAAEASDLLPPGVYEVELPNVGNVSFEVFYDGKVGNISAPEGYEVQFQFDEDVRVLDTFDVVDARGTAWGVEVEVDDENGGYDVEVDDPSFPSEPSAPSEPSVESEPSVDEESEVSEPSAPSEPSEPSEVSEPSVDEESELSEPSEESEVSEPSEPSEESEVSEPSVDEESEVSEPSVDEESEVSEPSVDEASEEAAESPKPGKGGQGNGKG